MATDLRLRFDYGDLAPWVSETDGDLAAVAGPDAVWLRGDVPLEQRDDTLAAEFDVSAGDRVAFVLAYAASYAGRPEVPVSSEALSDTEDYWHEWISDCRYEGRWAGAVRRSLLTLKALTYAPTGAVLAAATMSLPERPSGYRNWDYRYTWLRDATFTLQALLGGGYLDEARAWRDWLLRAAAGDPEELRMVYALDGSRRLVEQEIPWLGGYRGAGPVRIGNAAAGQLQLDVWGEVLQCLEAARRTGLSSTEDGWSMQRALVEYLERSWRQPDNSLWEVRGPRRHFVHSKVLAWAGLDSAIVGSSATSATSATGSTGRWTAGRRCGRRSTTTSARAGTTPSAIPSPSSTAPAGWTRPCF